MHLDLQNFSVSQSLMPFLHAGYELQGQILTDGDPFLPLTSELIRICGLLLVHSRF